MSTFKPKNKIMFPNKWAADSFLLKLKRSSGWDYRASNNEADIILQPKLGQDYILIGLLKSGSGYFVDINAEKMHHDADAAWNKINEFARLYRS